MSLTEKPSVKTRRMLSWPVSFIPIVLLTTTGILDATDIRRLNYDVLFLLAGGLALGNLVVRTGLSSWIVSGLPTESLGLVGVFYHQGSEKQ